MQTWTLGQLRQRCIDEVDAGTDPNGFITTANWTSWINSAISHVYRLLVRCYGENYYYATLQYAPVQGQASYPLPDDFYKAIGVDIALDSVGSNWQNALPYQVKQRNMFTQGYVPVAVVSPWYARYQFQDGNINWIPANQAPQTAFRINYTPAPPLLAADSDTFDGIAGFEERVVIAAALRAKDKMESDATVLLQRRQDWVKQIEVDGRNRDAAEPLRKVDSYQRGGFGWNGGGGWSGF